MCQRGWVAFLLIVLIVIFLRNVKSSENNYEDSSLINQTFTALRRDLDYILENYDEVNIDCIFGVTLARAILEDTSKNARKHKKELNLLLQKMKEIHEKAVSALSSSTPNFHFTKSLIEVNMWIRPVNFRPKKFANLAPTTESVLQVFSEDNSANKYSEGFSDACLALVINQTQDLKPKNCYLGPDCYDFIVNKKMSAHYVTTHKLLLLQTAKQRQCRISTKSYNFYTKTLCSSIFKQIISAETITRDFEGLFDLFLEQVMLCGYEGYSDFMQNKWLRVILAKQADSGCFKARQNFGKKVKREANELKDGCNDHTSGLGAGVLSLFLNYLMKRVE